MKTIKLLYDEGYDLFCRDINDDDTESVIPEEITFLEMYLEMYPEVTKLDILEIIEYVFFYEFCRLKINKSGKKIRDMLKQYMPNYENYEFELVGVQY